MYFCKFCAIGNDFNTFIGLRLLTYRDGFAFIWQHGRRLASVTKGTDSISYTYDPDGIRTSKTVNGNVTKFHIMNGTLLGQTKGNDTLVFLYDEKANKYGFDYNGAKYYYIFNLQGDVIGILNQAGTQVVSYQYDAWGKVLSVDGTQAATIGQLNPIRYRGYYYDTDTGFYYLQSRYYDPITRRFLNADGIIGANQDILSYNLFAYCSNNPINFRDPTGTMAGFAAAIGIVAQAALAIGAIAVVSYIATTPEAQRGWEGLGNAIADGFSTVYDAISGAFSASEAKAEEKDITLPNPPKPPAIFTPNPYDFNPKGLVMKEYPGTKNGRIIEWRDPISQAKIFEWNEDLRNGPHYHAMMIEWDGNHHGAHYLPGTPVPEPWNSIYFGG